MSLRDSPIRGGSLSAASTVTLRGLESAAGEHRSDCQTNIVVAVVITINNNSDSIEKL